MKSKLFLNRFFSIYIFAIGISTFIGADSYKDFYIELSSRIKGEIIDYAVLNEFCGWTGLPLPGESNFAYGLRSFWNMFSATMAMVGVNLILIGFISGAILWIFYYTGGLN